MNFFVRATLNINVLEVDLKRIPFYVKLHSVWNTNERNEIETRSLVMY